MQHYYVHPHPAVMEEGRREPLFLYDQLQVTFFTANARYVIETDSLELPNGQVDIVRFTHVPTGYYVVMARNLNIIGRPDLTLPWGHVRIRTQQGNGPVTFWHRQFAETAMQSIVSPRMDLPDRYAYDAVQFSAGTTIPSGVNFFLTTVEYPAMAAVRKLQAERVEELKHEDEQRNQAIMEAEHIVPPGAF